MTVSLSRLDVFGAEARVVFFITGTPMRNHDIKIIEDIESQHTSRTSIHCE